MIKSAYSSLIHIAAVALLLFCALAANGQECESCDDCRPVLAVRTNLLHDAALTPDLGLELGIGQRFSVVGQGLWAWWSKSSRNRFWRIYGGSGELRWWFGNKHGLRAMAGHHAGVYFSVHSFDFELGGKGWQSVKPVYGLGIAYGYSLPLNERLNLDFGLRLGYVAGKMVEYEPQCGTYVCTGRVAHRYVGPTAIEVSLVWFPGSGRHNSPLRTL